jgi:hypothetical protein
MFVAVTVAQFWAEAGAMRAASRESERRMRFIETPEIAKNAKIAKD